MIGDDFIKFGFWVQLIFLILVDWGFIVVFQKVDYVFWYYYFGFIVVNVVLFIVMWIGWKWFKFVCSCDVEDDVGDVVGL